jgi:small subunit ribosomal protein S1
MPNKFASFKKGEKASDIFKVGDKMEFKVITISPDENKVIVSRKDAMPNPYETFANEHKVGDEVRGRVKYITDFGMFIDLGDIEALVRREDFEGEYEVGDEFVGKIIEINGDRIKLAE